MRIAVSVPEEHVSPHVVNAVLEGVTRLNEQMIRAGQAPTSDQLLKQGAIWKPEPPGDERFDHGATIAQRGWGDCDDWAPNHAATLRVKGVDPGATAIVVPSGPATYHAIVKRSDGSLEDPSAAAGMKPKRAAVIGQGEGIDILACDPHNPSSVYQGSLLPTLAPMSLHCGPNFAVRSVGGGCFEGRCDVPIAGLPLYPMRTRRVQGAAVPYSLSSNAYHYVPGEALMHAIAGALACGLGDPQDNCKLVALQGMLAGASAEDTHAQLVNAMVSSGMDPYMAAHAAYQHVVGAAEIARRWTVRRHTAHRHRRGHRVHGVPFAAVRA
jgi:hypothetical protein